jgi:seryl-tRNA synthetase
MLDIKLLRDAPARITETLRDRGTAVFETIGQGDSTWAERTTEQLLELDRRYRELVQSEESLRREQNENAQAVRGVGKLPKDEQGAARQRFIDEGRALRDRERELTEQAKSALTERDDAWSRVPNLTHPDAPRGFTDDAHREIKRVGTIRDFAAEGFRPKDHVDLGETLGILDLGAGAKVAGQKFYFLKREAVLMDLALQHYALSIAQRHGFELHVTPDLARAEIVAGLGYNPRGTSTQIYSVADSDLCLVGTAEITLGGMLEDSILEEERLPIRVAGLSHCFRTEAGAAGKESRGLYRVHQFTKVELFAFTRGSLDASEAMHAELLAIEEEIFQGLGVPYRVIDTATGDLGGPAYRKFDLEAWMPGRGIFGEVTSTSNCTDYQARRLKIRYRTESDGKPKNQLVHMLNGTAVATSRALIAIWENYQQADGSIAVPEALRPWMGTEAIVRPVRH